MRKRLRFIISAFSVSFITMAALSLYSLQQFSTLTDYSDAVDHTNKVIARLYKIDNSIREFDTRERDYILTKDSTYAIQLVKMAGTIMPELNSLRNLIKDDSLQNQTLTLLRAALSMRYANFKDNIPVIDEAQTAGLKPYLYSSTKRRQECVTYLTRMMKRENILLHQRFQGKKKYQELTSNTIKYLIFIFGLVALILFILMIRELTRRLQYQTELQTKLMELRRSHAELEQIAFAASHDLQEPLRKIRMFGNRLVYLRKDDIDEDSKQTVDRINIAAGRMQDLIEDMVNLTGLIREDAQKERVNLNSILNEVKENLSEKIQEKNADIHQEVLPEIVGYSKQLQILFKSLLDNSLKFSRKDVIPVIHIRADRTTGEELTEMGAHLAQKTFYKITISDNGIGFDNKFAPKMFMIFHKLHTDEAGYEGQGIGLAICQRIMVNHQGYITAYGHMKTGATFKLFFPIPANA